MIIAGHHQIEISQDGPQRWLWRIVDVVGEQLFGVRATEAAAVRAAKDRAWAMRRQERVQAADKAGLTRDLDPNFRGYITSGTMLKLRSLTKVARLVFSHCFAHTLPRRPGLEGLERISYSSIGAHAGVSPRAAVYGVKELVAAGVIGKEHQKLPSKNPDRPWYDPNRYFWLDGVVAKNTETGSAARPTIRSGSLEAGGDPETIRNGSPEGLIDQKTIDQPPAKGSGKGRHRGPPKASAEAQALVAWCYDAPPEKESPFLQGPIPADYELAQALLDAHGEEGARALIRSAWNQCMAGGGKRLKFLVGLKKTIQKLEGTVPVPAPAPALRASLSIDGLVQLDPDEGRRVWSAWLAVMERRIGQQGVELWITSSHMQPLCLSRSGILMVVDSAYYRDWILDNLWVAMGEAWAEVLGQPVPFDVEVRMYP